MTNLRQIRTKNRQLITYFKKIRIICILKRSWKCQHIPQELSTISLIALVIPLLLNQKVVDVGNFDFHFIRFVFLGHDTLLDLKPFLVSGTREIHDDSKEVPNVRIPLILLLLQSNHFCQVKLHIVKSIRSSHFKPYLSYLRLIYKFLC